LDQLAFQAVAAVTLSDACQKQLPVCKINAPASNLRRRTYVWGREGVAGPTSRPGKRCGYVNR